MKFRGITIHKHKTCNTWYARYRANNKQFYVSAKTQQDCYNKLKVALKKQEQKKLKELKEPKQKEPKTITFFEWYKIWFETYKNKKVKDTTIMDYSASMKYIKSLNNKKITQLNNLEIMQILNKIPFERRKQKVYELLNDILNKAVKNNLIDKNPIIDEKPKHKKISGISLSIEDEKIFPNICNGKYKIFLICLYQGLRKGEALALTKKDFNLQEKNLTINKSLNALNYIDTTKNESSNRIIPLFENTINIIKSDLEKLKDNERIFNFSNQTAGKMFVELKKEFNLNDKYTIHSLRHTFITKCQESNIPLHIIQKWVGHTIGSKVTNNVYTHFRTEAEENYIKLLQN